MTGAKEQKMRAPEGKITLRIAIDMTTPGAVLLSAFAPALLGLLLAVEEAGRVSLPLSLLLLLIPALMNASVDVLNDYYDYIRGNDTPDNIVSESDGPLAYHQVKDPRPALFIGWGLLLAAAVGGIYVIWRTGPLPAVIGAAGGVILLTYSWGKLPTSFLPVGEPLAGFTLGGLVPLGVYAALTGHASWLVLYKSVPMMLIVAQFMLVNNTCDMERDGKAGRRTLPMVIGYKASRKLANGMNLIWMAQLAQVILVWYPGGWPVLVVVLLLCLKGIAACFREERTRENKTPATAAVAQLALLVAAGFPAAVALHLFL
ncbi:MAG: prenyltransferase [Clostridium sp.]|nr:prenyltransferase [Clostridium sp.]